MAAEFSVTTRVVVFSILMPAVGLGVVALGLHSAWKTHRAVSACVRTVGAVIQVVEMRGGSDSARTVTRAVVRFRGEDGRTHSFLAGGAVEFRQGEHVKVFYAAGHPEQARVESFAELYMLSSFWVMFGGVMVLFGLLAVRQIRRGMGPPGLRIGSAPMRPGQ